MYPIAEIQAKEPQRAELAAAMELRISRAQVRMIASAIGVTLRLRAKRRKTA